MKPFNLEAALAGEKVVTREGTLVTEIHEFRKARGEYRVAALVNDRILEYTPKGRYSAVGQGEYTVDLFMLPTKKEGWVNLYLDSGNGCSETFSSSIYVTEQQAITETTDSRARKFLARVKVEYEE